MYPQSMEDIRLQSGPVVTDQKKLSFRNQIAVFFFCKTFFDFMLYFNCAPQPHQILVILIYINLMVQNNIIIYK